MRTAIISFLIVSLNIGFSSFGQDLKLRGAYGNTDMRITASFGTLNDIERKNIVKVNNLPSSRISIGVCFPNTFSCIRERFSGTVETKNELEINLEEYIRSLILSSEAIKESNFIMVDKDDILNLGIFNNMMNGELKIFNREMLQKFQKKYNSDFLIVLIGIPNMNFIVRNGSHLDTQGIYSFSDKFLLYAGHKIGIFDLNTGKLIRNGQALQASADIVPFMSKKNFENYTEDEHNVFQQMLEERLKNNIKQTFSLLGLEYQ